MQYCLLWHATLPEKDNNGKDKLGTEIDLLVSYKILDGLNLDVIGAYLFAGGATTEKVTSDKNPYELDTKISLKF